MFFVYVLLSVTFILLIHFQTIGFITGTCNPTFIHPKLQTLSFVSDLWEANIDFTTQRYSSNDLLSSPTYVFLHLEGLGPLLRGLLLRFESLGFTLRLRLLLG